MPDELKTTDKARAYPSPADIERGTRVLAMVISMIGVGLSQNEIAAAIVCKVQDEWNV